MPVKAIYQSRKERGLCVGHKSCKNKPLRGKLLCLHCSMLKAERDKRYEKKHQNQRRIKHRERRKKYRQENKCPICGRPLEEDDKGFSCCYSCRHKQTIPHRQINQPLFPEV